MRNNIDELQKEADLLFGAISMRMNYWSYNKSIRRTKILLVEGATDKKFVDQYIKPEVLSQIGTCTFGSDCEPRGRNVKKTIVQIVIGTAKFKALLRIPPCMQDVEITGLIDRDFDSETVYSQNKNLFVTDTHDLETLILSTDASVLKRLDDCSLSDVDIQRSVFRAYQMGVVIPVLHEYKIDTRSISGGDSRADYNSFFDEHDRVLLLQLLECLVGDKKTARKFLLSAAKHKVIKSKFDKKHCWNGNLAVFYKNVPKDLWEKINGHDVLALIMFLNDAAALKFNSKSRLGRKFEMAIIEKYKKDNFKSTAVCRKMQERGVL